MALAPAVTQPVLLPAIPAAPLLAQLMVLTETTLFTMITRLPAVVPAKQKQAMTSAAPAPARQQKLNAMLLPILNVKLLPMQSRTIFALITQALGSGEPALTQTGAALILIAAIPMAMAVKSGIILALRAPAPPVIQADRVIPLAPIIVAQPTSATEQELMMIIIARQAPAQPIALAVLNTAQLISIVLGAPVHLAPAAHRPALGLMPAKQALLLVLWLIMIMTV